MSENSMVPETAKAFVAAAELLTTKDGSFYRVKRGSVKDGPDAARLGHIHSAMLRGDAAGSDWPAKVTELLADEDSAKDLLYLASTTSHDSRRGAVENWFSDRGFSDAESALAAEEFMRDGQDLSMLFFKLGEACTECVSLPPGFEAMFIAAARSPDRVVLPDPDWRDDVDLSVFDRACLEAEDASGLDSGESELAAARILERLASAGLDYRVNSGRQVKLRSLRGHLKRAAVKFWYHCGHVPPEGFYRDHVSGLVGFALRQSEFAASSRGERLGHLLCLEYCHAGRLAVRAADCSGDVTMAERDYARRSFHSIADICRRIESRGGCPGLIASMAAVGFDMAGLFKAAGRMLAWSDRLDAEPSSSEERESASWGDLFEAEPDEFGATGGADSRGNATVHTGRSRDFGSLFDE